MPLNYEALFNEMAQSPQVKEAVRKKAEDLRDFMETRWPEVNDLTETQRNFLKKEPEHSILITESTRSNRPTHIVTVRHPGAIAKQAATGFATRAVKDVS